MYNVTTSFMTLTPAVSLYYGFVGGAISGGLLVGSVVLANELRFIVPNQIFYSSQSIALKNGVS